jgi:HSP20 family protein
MSGEFGEAFLESGFDLHQYGVPVGRLSYLQREDLSMSEAATKLPVKTEKRPVEQGSAPQSRSSESLRQQVNRLFDDFDLGVWANPFRRSMFAVEPFWQHRGTRHIAPAVNIADYEKAYEITAELPGLDEKNVEMKVTNGALTIRGEKLDEEGEKKRGYYLHERDFGSFERRFRVPEDADIDKIEASFKKGVLTVTLPKRPEVQKAEKKITVKAA